MKLKKAIFPGSFDPITKGHESVILRALDLFDELYVAIGQNAEKKYMFSLEQRMHFLQKTFADYQKVKVVSYEGLTVDFCAQQEIKYVVRGLRSSLDFTYEQSIAMANKSLNDTVETIFLICDARYTAISSSIVRDVLKNNGNVSSFVPKAIKDEL